MAGPRVYALVTGWRVTCPLLLEHGEHGVGRTEAHAGAADQLAERHALVGVGDEQVEDLHGAGRGGGGSGHRRSVLVVEELVVIDGTGTLVPTVTTP